MSKKILGTKQAVICFIYNVAISLCLVMCFFPIERFNEKISRRLKRSAVFNCWTLFFPIFEFQVFNSYKFVCIIGNKDEIARNCLSCDEHVVRADKISFFF